MRPDVILFNLVQNFDKVNRGHIQTWDRAHWKNFLERILELDVVEYPTDSIRIPKLDEVKWVQPPLMALAKVFPGFARSCMAVVRR